ncbi:unnamed protein product [Staurois parvus]|uniref:Uncharacterized protein n=1 Tax=Staurois parvus TaxID=386267 RepID=A0ABN9HBQ8_9NEOB|nr:unnamed protein product [Staurois parvus]
MIRQARGSTGDGQQRSGSKQGQQRGRDTGYQVQGLMGNIHQGPDHRPGHSLNTPPAISPGVG